MHFHDYDDVPMQAGQVEYVGDDGFLHVVPYGSKMRVSVRQRQRRVPDLFIYEGIDGMNHIKKAGKDWTVLPKNSALIKLLGG